MLFVGSLGVGFLNYLYYPVLGRLLQPGTFGEVQTLASLLAQIMIFLSVLGLLTINIVANYEDGAKRNQTLSELERLALFIALALVAVTAAISPMLRQFFNFGSSLPFVIMAAAVAVSVPYTFRSSFLRGKHLFTHVSLVAIVASASDLVLAAVFVLLGWGTAGAIAGLLVGQLIALVLAAVLTSRRGYHESLRGTLMRLPDLRLIAPELKYALLVLIGSLGITGLYSVDAIAVKHYFDARTAGLYAGIATIARIVYFVTGSVVQVLLPTVKLRASPRENQQILLKSLILLCVVGGGVLMVFGLLPRLVIRLLMGATYLRYASLLPRLSIVIFIISLLNLFIMYHMALRRYAIMVIVIIGSTATYGLLRVHHASLQAVIDSLLFGSLSTMALLGGWLIGAQLKRKRLNAP